MLFYLGVHRPHWLEKTDVPLFVSHRTLRERKSDLAPTCQWGVDSGGFTELSTFGRWTITEDEYVDAVYRYKEWGGMTWASPQDWMTEPWVTKATGLSVEEHLYRTVDSVKSLRAKAPDLPFVPVLQGQTIKDYLRCVDLYRLADIDLWAEPVIGLGSVCRRQSEREILDIVNELAGLGLKLHGYGVKILGLAKYGPKLVSADSMAWSFRARRSEPLPGHTHANCANCLEFALLWRQRLLKETA